MKSNYKIHILGCRGSFPIFGKQFLEFGGSTTSYLICNGTHAIIVDCGSGLINAKDIIKDCKTIDVFFSHVHYDHIIGLLGRKVFPENAKITFYGDFKTWFNKETMKDTFLVPPFWPVDINYGNYVQFNSDATVKTLENNIEVSCIPAHHPNDCSTLKFIIDERVVSFLCDCEECDDAIISFVGGADILFYDSMFDEDDYSTHKGWGHSTWKEGCDLAKKANVKRLYPTHHNYEYDDNKLLDMEKRCQKEFVNSYFSREGMVIEL